MILWDWEKMDLRDLLPGWNRIREGERRGKSVWKLAFAFGNSVLRHVEGVVYRVCEKVRRGEEEEKIERELLGIISYSIVQIILLNVRWLAASGSKQYAKKPYQKKADQIL